MQESLLVHSGDQALREVGLMIPEVFTLLGQVLIRKLSRGDYENAHPSV